MRLEPMWPANGIKAKFDRELDLAATFHSHSSWTKESVARQLNAAAEALADCGVRLRRVQFYENVHGSCWDKDLTKSFQMKDGESRIVLDFGTDKMPWQRKEERPQGIAYNELELVRIYPEVMSSPIDEKFVLTHELGHKLGGLLHSNGMSPDVMSPISLSGRMKSRFTPEQCAKIRSHRMLFPVSRARSDADLVKHPMPKALSALGERFELAENLMKRGQKELAFFYYVKVAIYDSMAEDIMIPRFLVAMAKEYGLGLEEALSIYANVHFWRPENRLPEKKGDLKRYTRADLYWISDFSEFDRRWTSEER